MSIASLGLNRNFVLMSWKRKFSSFCYKLNNSIAGIDSPGGCIQTQ